MHDVAVTSTDEALLSRLRAHDAGAFDALCARDYAFTLGHCRSVVKDDFAAQDLAQDVFARLWTSPPRYCGASIRPFLKRVAVNAGIDFLRRRRETATDALEHTGPAETTEDTVIAALESAALRRLLGCLRPVERRTIAAHFYLGRSHAQIAGDLRLPLGTVKTHIRSGMRKLRCLGRDALAR